MDGAAHADGVAGIERKNAAGKDADRFGQLVDVAQKLIIGDERNFDAGKGLGAIASMILLALAGVISTQVVSVLS